MKITAVEAFPIRLPRDWNAAKGTAGSPNALLGEGEYRWSKDYPCLYPVHFETALIKVTLDSGLYGWGEAQAPLAPEVACAIVNRLLRPALVGSMFNGHEMAALWRRMYSTMRVRGQTGGFMLDAISGVDLALWDLAGKIKGKPVCELLAPSPRKTVPAYLSGVPNVEYALKSGFSMFKVYYESDWGAMLTLMEKLPGRVAVDALWHGPEERYQELDERGALWLECPLMPEDAAAHAALALRLKTPIAIGESYRTLQELSPFFESRAMQYVQPDLGRAGITESMRIAARAKELGMKTVPHVSIAMGPQIAAAIHFAAAACELCEYNPRVLEVANRFLREPLAVKGTEYVVPRGMGLGVEVVGFPVDQGSGS